VNTCSRTENEFLAVLLIPRSGCDFSGIVPCNWVASGSKGGWDNIGCPHGYVKELLNATVTHVAQPRARGAS